MQIIPANYSASFDNFLLTDPQTVREKLASVIGGITLYNAGLPNYPYNFTRDSILSGILMKDPVMLREQLIFSSLLQGDAKNPYTGEEPGKIFHQMPGMRQSNLSTEYNACDTTALFLYGHEIYLDLTNDYYFIERQKKYLEKAVSYIFSHLVNYLFVEDPKLSNAKRFALKLTYWKDSQVPNRKDGYPLYPAVFTLAHVQNMRALKSAAKLLSSPSLLETVNEMKRHLSILFDEKRGVFASGIDQKGFFPGTSSDNLHMLYYLEPGEISDEKINKIIKNTTILESSLGYITLKTKDEWLSNDITIHTGYHTDAVWPFEQAFIHAGALKFGLKSVTKICERIYSHIDGFYPELFRLKDGKFHSTGCHTQLWTIGARIYFDEYFQSANSSK
jgi:glycogen debranching enzyme